MSILFIVESPNKCTKLNKILGKDYKVKASVGHIRSIPRKGLNIDVKNDFKPVFEISKDKKKVVEELKSIAKNSDEIILATDADREGEAISWHIYELFDKSCKKKCTRVTFQEITKSAVLKSLDNKRDIDMDLVHAQHARQILDRLVGYKISPVLWVAVGSGTSAGRVQSIALKIICEREKEIQNFKPTDFWYLDALLKNDKGEFTARVITKDKDNKYLDEEQAKKDYELLKKSKYFVDQIDKKEKKVDANPPFDTSSMLQTASTVFHWPVKKTTSLAQSIYEKGLATYIRTDSYNISPEAMTEVRKVINGIGKEYLPSKPNYYKKKSKAAAQEAHECIRPTTYDISDEILTDDEEKLFNLIKDRFLACQMKPMILNTVSCQVKTDSNKKLIAKGQTVKFDGWSKVYKYFKTKENELPVLEEKEELDLKDLENKKGTTQPPPRYNESSLVKKMEKEGVGRPSTYASIMESIKKRAYVDQAKNNKSNLQATELGMKVFDYLDSNFKDFFMDITFTSKMEDNLSEIADGKKDYLLLLKEVYELLMSEVKKTNATKKISVETGEKCQKCEGDIVEKNGKYGKFFACGNYPKCKTVYEIINDKFVVKTPHKTKTIGVKCPKCSGELVERVNRKTKETFYGCMNYPKCKYIENDLKNLGL